MNASKLKYFLKKDFLKNDEIISRTIQHSYLINFHGI